MLACLLILYICCFLTSVCSTSSGEDSYTSQYCWCEVDYSERSCTIQGRRECHCVEVSYVVYINYLSPSYQNDENSLKLFIILLYAYHRVICMYVVLIKSWNYECIEGLHNTCTFLWIVQLHHFTYLVVIHSKAEENCVVG